MAAVAAAARALRLDVSVWRRMAPDGSLPTASLIVLGSYLLLAFDRFGAQGLVEPRATVRVVLIGFYGWIGLAVGASILARFAFGSEVALERVIRLFGHAHLPLLLIGVLIQFFSSVVSLGLIALLMVGVWMAALLVIAASASMNLDWPAAATAALVPFAAWAVLVGRPLWNQLDHLL